MSSADGAEAFEELDNVIKEMRERNERYKGCMDCLASDIAEKLLTYAEGVNSIQDIKPEQVANTLLGTASMMGYNQALSEVRKKRELLIGGER